MGPLHATYAAERLNDLLHDLVLAALAEGGFDFERPAMHEALAGLIFAGGEADIELFSIENHGYVLSCTTRVPTGEALRNPRVAQLDVRLSRANGSPSLLFSRRTNGNSWHTCARGTLSLPTGQPLGELVHGEKHLDMKASRMCVDRSDKEAFQDLMKVARIFERDQI